MTLRAKYGKDYSDDQIKWNFTKFLIDREGNVVKRYESPVVPEDIAGDIEKLL
jgi:glutathione peroxidase